MQFVVCNIKLRSPSLCQSSLMFVGVARTSGISEPASQLLFFLACNKVEKEAEMQRYLFCLRFSIFWDTADGYLNPQANSRSVTLTLWSLDRALFLWEDKTWEGNMGISLLSGTSHIQGVEIERQNFPAVCCEEVNSHRSSKSRDKGISTGTIHGG